MTEKRTPEDVSISPRDIKFSHEGAKNPHWLDNDPVGTAIMNTLSLTFPDGERMFMDSVRNYRGELSGKLLQDVKDFIHQEAIHSREHHLMNQLIDREKYPVEEIEGFVRERVAFARSGGPMRMLIGTICLEHFTAMMADMMVEHQDVFQNTDPEIEAMWRWHAMEETEHKAVAYDVFLEVSKDWSGFKRYMRRCISMLIISKTFTNNIATYAAMLLEAEGWDKKDAKKAINKYLWKTPSLFGRGWKVWLSWFKPGFHPWDHDNRALMTEWKAEFDAIAAE
ncbi:metal-dependent hydrolase [Ponticaulis sp.]|uniref:metal-dependent hydrolase n=1 Tax=Ponticaulis sp. TaxID=2020902 RepID=UPI000C4DD494|nr:metal-dependent hydrolase [Ponticaulis sp.]MBN03403.1 metal-dependent hydrolase [Ponticaulis sp.]|tara:strand:+ start:861 stop:1703 length:843 start_codon:yes stop_codon:yes gene_type:complete